MSFRATVLTLFPAMFPGPLGQSLAGRALEAGIWSLDARDIRDVTTDRHRMASMIEALRACHVPHSPGAQLFFFTTRAELQAGDPLLHNWQDGNGRDIRLI